VDQATVLSEEQRVEAAQRTKSGAPHRIDPGHSESICRKRLRGEVGGSSFDRSDIALHLVAHIIRQERLPGVGDLADDLEPLFRSSFRQSGSRPTGSAANQANVTTWS